MYGDARRAMLRSEVCGPCVCRLQAAMVLRLLGPSADGRRRRWIAVGAAAVVAAAAGIASAAIPDSPEFINGCVHDETGQLRVVADPGACRPSEKPVSWSKDARATPSYSAVQYEVEVTAVGTTDIGLPTEDSPATPIVSLTLPQGVYLIHTSVNALRPAGSGIFSCWAHEAGTHDVTGQWTALARTALGNAAGYARWVALAGSGFFNAGSGGATVTLECWNFQAYGGNPDAFLSSIDAVPVTSATITFPGWEIEYP